MKLSTGKRASRLALALALCIGAGSVTVQAHDELNGRPHHIDTPANPTAVMRAFSEGKLGDTDLVQNLAAMAETPCDTATGFAGIYPCYNVDLMAFMPLAEIGSTQSNDEANDIWGWTDPMTENEYAIIGRVFGTSFVDVTDPTAPIYLGELRTHGVFGSPWRDIKVYQNYAFIVSEASRHGMQVFDLTQLRDLPPADGLYAETAHYDGFGSAHNIVINEDSGFAYGVGTNVCSGGLEMVNIQDPLNPTGVGCYSADGYTHDAQCVNYSGPDLEHHDKEICFASNEDTLTIVDVTDKSNPALISRTTYTDFGYTHQGWLTEDQAYFVLDDELDEQDFGHNTRTRVWDLSILNTPMIDSTYDALTSAIDHNLYIKGSCVFQANYRAGLRILGLGTTTFPTLFEAGHFDIYPTDDLAEFNAAWSNYPYFPSGTVVVSGIEQGLFVLKPAADIQALCASDSPPPPPPPPPPGTLHIGDLDGSVVVDQQNGRWTAEVKILVHDQAEAAVEGATVNGGWSSNGPGSSSCTTGTDGICRVTRTTRRNLTATSFTVEDVTHPSLPYAPGDNHDPDGDSDGTVITVTNP